VSAFSTALLPNAAGSLSCSPGGVSDAHVSGLLAAGASETFVLTFTAPDTGSYTMRAFVDRDCQETEFNETNNQSTLSYTVQGRGSDLIVQSLVSNKGSYSPFESGSATVTITYATTRGAVSAFSTALHPNAAGSLSCSPGGASDVHVTNALAA